MPDNPSSRIVEVRISEVPLYFNSTNQITVLVTSRISIYIYTYTHTHIYIYSVLHMEHSNLLNIANTKAKD